MSKELSEELMDEIKNISDYLGDRFFGYEWSSNGVREKNVKEHLENKKERKTLENLCKVVLSVNPADYSGNIALGSIHGYNKDYSQAIKYIEKGLQENEEEVISENFNHIYCHVMLGHLYRETKNFQNSFKNYLRATDELNKIGIEIIKKHEKNVEIVNNTDIRPNGEIISGISQYTKTREQITNLIAENNFQEAYEILEDLMPKISNSINQLNNFKFLYEFAAIGTYLFKGFDSMNQTDPSSPSDI